MLTKVFLNGRSQAVRIPKELRFKEREVTVRSLGDGVFLEPVKAAAWPEGYFANIRIGDEAFVRGEQGALPEIPGFDP